MRLLHTSTHILETFLSHKKPRYAILSHTWGEDEILYQDVQSSAWKSTTEKRSKAGADKVIRSCLQAKEDGLDYIWIDTCCIDKNSSAELSEAINSMFKWYAESDVCYAYLSDLTRDRRQVFDRAPADFSTSRWFTRGWTLQELIAPQNVVFFDRTWHILGTRDGMATEIARITSIDRAVLSRSLHEKGCYEEDQSRQTRPSGDGCISCGQGLSIKHLLPSFPVATRMSWAANRETTRLEDEAYCLLGLFAVHMPLLYGEGSNSFQRLQEEILRTTTDHSILAYEHRSKSVSRMVPLLASSPYDFRNCGQLCFSQSSWQLKSEIVLTNKTARLSVPLCAINVNERGEGIYMAILDCVYGFDFISRPAIILKTYGPAGDDIAGYVRINHEGHSVKRIATSPRGIEYATATPDLSPLSRSYSEHTTESDTTLISLRDIQYDMDISILRKPAQAWEEHALFRPIPMQPIIRLDQRPLSQSGYHIRYSHPRLVDGFVRIPSETEYRGIMAIDDGHSHGFFVAWHYRDVNKLLCQVRSWEYVYGRGFRPVKMEPNGSSGFSNEELQVQVQMCFQGEGWHEWKHRQNVDGRMVSAKIEMPVFLGQRVLQLTVDISDASPGHEPGTSKAQTLPLRNRIN